MASRQAALYGIAVRAAAADRSHVRRWRRARRSAAPLRPSCTRPAMRPATSCSTVTASRSSATVCSPARSGAPTCPLSNPRDLAASLDRIAHAARQTRSSIRVMGPATTIGDRGYDRIRFSRAPRGSSAREAHVAVALLLAAWLGAGILFAAVVAPAAFAVLPSRTLAGALVGRVLPVDLHRRHRRRARRLLLDRAERRTAIRALGARARRHRDRVCARPSSSVAPRIERVRRRDQRARRAAAAGDPTRVAFGRLHAESVAWLGLAMLGAAGRDVAGISACTSRRLHGARPGGNGDALGSHDNSSEISGTLRGHRT